MESNPAYYILVPLELIPFRLFRQTLLLDLPERVRLIIFLEPANLVF
jgi:hypothetical protein